MDTSTLLGAIDNVDDELETLEDVLRPILDDSLHSTTRKLPLLDRAKLSVTVVYAIESLLFSYLRVNGVNAKDHQVFKELARTKQYFDKIREAEEKHTKPSTPSISLNKQAAQRIIQHSLAGNITPEERARRAEELKKKILANRKPSTPTPVLSPLADPPLVTNGDASKLLESISHEIEMGQEDAEGSEEGEIDESAMPPEPMLIAPQPPLNTLQPLNKKRKHNGLPSKINGSKSEKRARKKAKKEAKSAG